eukprot:1157953-Pelagomonas_calceolata.AAC.3
MDMGEGQQSCSQVAMLVRRTPMKRMKTDKQTAGQWLGPWGTHTVPGTLVSHEHCIAVSWHNQ